MKRIILLLFAILCLALVAWSRFGEELGEVITVFSQLSQPEETVDPDSAAVQTVQAFAREQGLTLEEVRQRISGSLGQILKAVHDHGVEGTLLITGGDTLKQCMDRLEVYQIEPLCELEPGVVLSRFTYQDVTRYVISKSGGFGSEDLLVSLTQRLAQQV